MLALAIVYFEHQKLGFELPNPSQRKGSESDESFKNARGGFTGLPFASGPCMLLETTRKSSNVKKQRFARAEGLKSAGEVIHQNCVLCM